MTTGQTLLVIAIVLVYMAWRAARRQARQQQQQTIERVERNTFMLEPESDGFRVLAPDGAAVDAGGLRWEHQGLELVSGVRLEAGPGERRPAPGMDVELIPEDDGTLHVWNRAMTDRLGTLPDDAARRFVPRIDAGDVTGCVILRESDGAYDLLVVHTGVDLEP